VKTKLPERKTSNDRMTAVSTVAPRKIFYNANRQRISTLCVVSASWKLDFGWKLPATFLRAQKVSKYLRFDFPHSFRNPNPRSKSAIKVHKEFQEFWILSKQNFAQKKKEMSWSKWEF
jgi:hypothetical protein